MVSVEERKKRWLEHVKKEVVKHPHEIVSDSPEMQRRWRWSARGRLAVRHLEESLQKRADEFSRVERVPTIAVHARVRPLREDVFKYRLDLKPKPTLLERSIEIATGGATKEQPVMLGGLYHELGHHKHAVQNVAEFIGLGKSGQRLRGMAMHKANVRAERIAWGYADPYLERRPIQRWDRLMSLTSYRVRRGRRRI
jgi:hypothetical protein